MACDRISKQLQKSARIEKRFIELEFVVCIHNRCLKDRHYHRNEQTGDKSFFFVSMFVLIQLAYSLDGTLFLSFVKPV